MTLPMQIQLLASHDTPAPILADCLVRAGLKKLNQRLSACLSRLPLTCLVLSALQNGLWSKLRAPSDDEDVSWLADGLLPGVENLLTHRSGDTEHDTHTLQVRSVQVLTELARAARRGGSLSALREALSATSTLASLEALLCTRDVAFCFDVDGLPHVLCALCAILGVPADLSCAPLLRAAPLSAAGAASLVLLSLGAHKGSTSARRRRRVMRKSTRMIYWAKGRSARRPPRTAPPHRPPPTRCSRSRKRRPPSTAQPPRPRSCHASARCWPPPTRRRKMTKAGAARARRGRAPASHSRRAHAPASQPRSSRHRRLATPRRWRCARRRRRLPTRWRRPRRLRVARTLAASSKPRTRLCSRRRAPRRAPAARTRTPRPRSLLQARMRRPLPWLRRMKAAHRSTSPPADRPPTFPALQKRAPHLWRRRTTTTATRRPMAIPTSRPPPATAPPTLRSRWRCAVRRRRPASPRCGAAAFPRRRRTRSTPRFRAAIPCCTARRPHPRRTPPPPRVSCRSQRPAAWPLSCPAFQTCS